MNLVVDIEIPDGWEPTGEIRFLREGEYGLRIDTSNEILTHGLTAYRCVILRKKQPEKMVGQVWDIADHGNVVLIEIDNVGWRVVDAFGGVHHPRPRDFRSYVGRICGFRVERTP